MTIAFIVTRFVCPAVTAADHARITTNGAIDVTNKRVDLSATYPKEKTDTEQNKNVLEIQYAKSSPTFKCDERALTSIDPKMATMYARIPEYARPCFQYVADVTVQKITMTMMLYVNQSNKPKRTEKDCGQTFYHTVDASDERSLDGIEPKSTDDNLTLVTQLYNTGRTRKRKLCQSAFTVLPTLRCHNCTHRVGYIAGEKAVIAIQSVPGTTPMQRMILDTYEMADMKKKR